MNKYLNIFLKSSLFFGLSMGVLYSIQNQNILAVVIFGAIVGILFGIIISSFVYITDKKLKNEGLVNNSADVYQVREYIVHNPSVEIMHILKDALSTLKKYKILKEEVNSITAKTGFSWKSFGEIISISYESTDYIEYKIKISSRPAIKTTLVDYGKNLQNVETLEKYLQTTYGDRLEVNT